MQHNSQLKGLWIDPVQMELNLLPKKIVIGNQPIQTIEAAINEMEVIENFDVDDQRVDDQQMKKIDSTAELSPMKRNNNLVDKDR